MSAALRTISWHRISWRRIYCAALLWFVARAIRAACVIDQELAREAEDFPEGFTFSLFVYPRGPGMMLEKKDGYLKPSRFGKSVKTDNSIMLKSLEAAFRLFTFRESTCVSEARSRLVAEGEIPEICAMVRILNRVEIYLLPKILAERAVKRYARPPYFLRNRFLVYLGTLTGIVFRGGGVSRDGLVSGGRRS